MTPEAETHKEAVEEVEAQTNSKDFYNKMLVYTLVFLLLSIILLIIYYFTHYEFITKNNLENNYVKTSNIKYNNLPLSIQNQYLPKTKCTNEIKILKDPESVILQKKLKDVSNDLGILKEKNSIVINKQEAKILTLSKQIKELEEYKYTNTNTNNKDFLLAQFKSDEIVNNHIKDNATKTASIMCADMPKYKSYISKKCLKKIKQFVQKNKDSNYFEVIAMLGKNEKLNNYKKLALSNLRSSEIIWQTRLYLKFKTKVFPVNYIINSNKNYKGAIIRAFK